MNKKPIGIFDSGVGGLSIWSEITALLPNEDTIYLADSKNSPYGNRPKEEILRLSIKNTERLLSEGCKIVVVACNTATTNAIDYLRANYDVPFIGIEPAIKPAALNSANKKVGVLATKGTLASDLFHHTAQNHASGITIIEQEGTGLVELVEEGKASSQDTKIHLKKLLQPMMEAKIDHLVLGCTHYPFLRPLLEEILPPEVRILDCGEAVARQTKKVLEGYNLLNPAGPGLHKIIGNGDYELLKEFTAALAGTKEVVYEDF